MGVHGVWDLLAPVGRRVSVETLTGKRLAIDASIWMVQFMKAMRDERGEMVRNAHLLGFFRRICKLLFLRTKPVFVFDGGTPALKRRTVVARRRQRENAQAKIRKTAEKLLLNHVKAMRLKQLSDDLQDQMDKNKSKGKEVVSDKSDVVDNSVVASEGHNREMMDEMLAASIQAQESGELDTVSSFAAEIGSSSGNASASAFPKEDGEDESDEEMILPLTDGIVDPAVLAALPPSMQLDLLVQMRERLMAENRQKYQKVKKAPQKFSELQIEAYLKTVAFRREIDQVQKAASGKGVGGVQTSRIASESNREFIFSSSFSGDKQLFASGGAEKIPETQQVKENRTSSFDILNAMVSATKSITEAEPAADEAVQTFTDERGNRRVSSRRAMGIRMTRDLQRNIDLMKELEQETTAINIEENSEVNLDMEGHSVESQCNGKPIELVNEFNCDVLNSLVNSSLEPEGHKDALKSETCIKVSFDDDVKHSSLDGDDEFFAHLVAGEQVPIPSADSPTSDCGLKDGTISGKNRSLTDRNNMGTICFHAQDGNIIDSDLEWEEGSSLVNENTNMNSFDVEDNKAEEIAVSWKEGLTVADSHEDAQPLYSDIQKVVSKGTAEEEAALQEAIKRSLEDSPGVKSSSVSCDLKADDNAFNRQLQLETFSPLLSSHLGSVSDGCQLSPSLVSECDPYNSLAGKGTYASSSLGLHSTSAALVAVGSDPHMGTQTDLNKQQLSSSTDNAQTSYPTDIAVGVLPATLPENVDDVCHITTDTAALSNSGIQHEFSTGQTTSVLGMQTLHSDVKTTVGEDDACFVNAQEQNHDVEFSAFNDEENTLPPLGFNMEDELLVLDQEYKSLGDEQKRLERNADSVNAEMFVDCQELLQMFGLPYIIAPMEAEAQCAYMELANLVDGVVTDDSDVFLFGAQSVYKNIFDDRKYVETYFMKDIENELGLNREKLIRMALLLGSDYTEGVSGIGIVNAIEVMNAFPEEDGFHKFREWIESPDPAILGKVEVQSGLSSRKKGSKASKKGMSHASTDTEENSAADSNTFPEHEDIEAKNNIQIMKQTFMNKHRNVSKNWHIPSSFPNDAVISAYAAPQVDKSTEPFAWGKPDVFSLRRLCWEKFGWACQKADELLSPVLKEYNKRETQLRLEAFYTFNERFAKIRSKRIKKAVKGITGKQSLNLHKADDLPEKSPKTMELESCGKIRSKKFLSKGKDHVEERNNSDKKLKSKRAMENKEGLSTEVGSIGLSSKAGKRSLIDSGSSRVRERQKRTAAGRGRKKEISDSDCDETSVHDHNCSSDELGHAVLVENIELPESVRRSKRARKAANYLEEEEGDELVTPPKRTNKDRSDDGADRQRSPHFLSVHEADVVSTSKEREFTRGDLPGHGLHGDYLVMGGGFCAEEDEAEIDSNQFGSNQMDTHIVHPDIDYLQMGGGICVEDEGNLDIRDCEGGGASTVSNAYTSTSTGIEESGIAMNQHEILTVPEIVPDTVELKDPSSYFEVNPGDKHRTIDNNLPNIAGAINEAAPTSVNPFSALPFLKRKKRKP